MATALKVSADFLLGLADEATPTRDILDTVRKRDACIFDLKDRAQPGADTDDSAYIEVNEKQSGAGCWPVAGGRRIKSMMDFPRRWLRDRGLEPGQCRVMRMGGQSMEPTLPDGCAVLIDLQSRIPKDDRIYVFRVGEEVVVKRVIHGPNGGRLLISDNPNKKTYPTRHWPEDGTIIGEIKWHAAILQTSTGTAPQAAGQ